MIMNKEIFQEEVNKFLTSNGETKVIFEKGLYPESIVLDSEEAIEEVRLFLIDLGLSEIMAHTVYTSEHYNYILLEDIKLSQLIGLVVMDEYGEVQIYN